MDASKLGDIVEGYCQDVIKDARTFRAQLSFMLVVDSVNKKRASVAMQACIEG